MERADSRKSWASGAAVGLAIVLALTLSWRATGLYGLGVDGDAAWTLSAGSSLAQGGGLVTCLGEVFSLWPPLYPLSMAALETVGLDVLGSLRVLQLIALALSIALAARLAWNLSGSHVAAVATAGSLALSTRMHEYTVQVVSESFFQPLVLGSLLVALALAERFTRGRFVALVVLSALACLQRYLGVALVASIALFFVVSPSWGSFASRLKRVAAFGALALAPLALWFLRNRLVEDKWTGGRDETPVSLGEALQAAWGTLVGWAGPAHLPASVGGIFVVVGALLLAGFTLRQPQARRAVLLLVLFSAVHVTLLVGMAANVVIDPIGDRLMLPLLPVLVALVWSALLGTWRTPTWLAGALVAAFWLDALPRTAERIDFWRREGAGGFHTRLWQEHPVTLALREVELVQPIWSNGAELVWLERGERAHFLRGGAKAWERAAKESAAAGGGTLLWFQDKGRPAANLDALEAHVQVRELVKVPDGLLLRLQPRP